MKRIFLFALCVSMSSCSFLGLGANTGVSNESADSQEEMVPDSLTRADSETEEEESEAQKERKEKRAGEIRVMTEEIRKYDELRNYIPFNSSYFQRNSVYGELPESYGTFYIRGNFYGEREDDLAILLERKYEDPDEAFHARFDPTYVGLCIINQGTYGVKFVSFDDEAEGDDVESDPTGGGFSWADVFSKVNRGNPLWSNYEDDFRNFEDVPEDEIVRLDYDAMYVHVAEACGGGFIFWKDGKFNWLQQE